jgi:transcriptional regulator GlxA family with amidase domain
MGAAPPKLIEAVSLMEANVDEPIFLEDMAKLLEISRRQLERLFKANLDSSPSRYYLRIRLYRARQLLKQTSLPVIEIASICGFVSTPHFSKCYRTYLGIPPSEERSRAKNQGHTKRSPKEVGDAHPEVQVTGAVTEPSYGSIPLLADDET